MGPRQKTGRLALLCACVGIGCAPLAFAQTAPATGTPLSVIDWLGQQTAPATRPPVKPPKAEPAVTASGTAPAVTVTPLGAGKPREIGLVPANLTGLPADLWQASDVARLSRQIDKLPDLSLPAAQSLLYTLLLADARAPQDLAPAGDTLALARVGKLMRLGALDPALSLIEQAGVTTSTAHFDLWMDISLLSGTEDRACQRLRQAPHLTRDYGVRIFCAARAGDWETATLTFGSAQALKLIPQQKLDLLDRFLNADLFEDASPLPPPRQMDPLSFRLFETIGERLPSGNLPRAYAVADLRDVAGWKAQLEAAERLTRAGALPDNRLLGLYTNRKPAASGGIWDRVAALQRFETALTTRSPDALAKTLPPVWQAMQEARLETSFASLFAERLNTLSDEVTLDARTARIVLDVGLMSPAYEASAARAADDPATAFLRSVAQGAPSTSRPRGALAAAVYDGFTTAEPREDLVAQARAKRLGETVLTLLALLEEGAQGDISALRTALATLRALGLEDTARRAALQALLRGQ